MGIDGTRPERPVSRCATGGGVGICQGKFRCPKRTEPAFLDASKEQAQHETREREEQQQRELDAAQELVATQQRANKQLRRRAIFLAGAFALALVLAGVALLLANIARTQTERATRNSTQTQSLALTSAAQLSANRDNPELGLAYALAANRLSPPAIEAQAPLADLAYTTGLEHIFTGHTAEVNFVTFSPDGKTALSAGANGDNTVILWDVLSGKILRRFEGHTDGVATVSISPDGKTAASGSFDKTLILWDMATGQVLHRLKGHTNGVWLAAFSADGKTLLSASDDESLILWDVATGQIIRRLDGLDGLWIAAFSPDGKTALAGYKDGKINLLDLATGQALRTFQGHTDHVSSISFSPDGKTALSASADKSSHPLGCHDRSIASPLARTQR